MTTSPSTSSRGPALTTRRWRLALVGGAALLAAALGASAGSAAPSPTLGAAPEGPAVAPPGDARPQSIDDEAMRHRMIHEKASDVSTASDLTQVAEQEKGAASGTGVRSADAQRLPSSPKVQEGGIRINGSLGTTTPEPQAISPSTEDDGSIGQARDLRLGRDSAVSTTGRIGDGPHGSTGTGTGDYDYYEVTASTGDTLTIDLTPKGELVPNILLYDSDGELVVGAQDLTTGTGEAHLSHPVEEGGDYYVAIGQHYPQDPFDPASGPGALTEGPYDLDVSRQGPLSADTDVYALPLRKGDVVGATVKGAAGRMALHDSRGRLVQASSTDVGSIYPDDSPLPRGGNATTDHVVERSGLYFLAVSDGAGDYSATVRASRPPATTKPQTIYLDFTGPRFDNRVFGEAAVDPGVKKVSPMRDSLTNWGLTTADEREVITETTKRVRETLRDDIPGSRVRVVNSLDQPDLAGRPGVSRVIVGGSAEQAGVMPSFGVSGSVDPGNFDREDTAIVLPEPMGAGDEPPSLNAFLTDDSDRVRAVSRSLGNVAAHEAGHFLGNHHTDDEDDHTNVMNTGNLLHFYAFGEDTVAGTPDDDRIAMGDSRYDPFQGLVGTESTTARTRAALRSR